MAVEMITTEVAAGKTIKALEFLQRNGGGLYIGSGETEAYIKRLCEMHGFENIRVIILPPDVAVAIDNEERFKIAITKTKRKAKK